MKVYLVTYIDYEIHQTLGIYSTKELAITRAKQWSSDYDWASCIEIKEFILDKNSNGNEVDNIVKYKNI